MRIFSLVLAAVVTLVTSGAFAQDVLLFEDFNDSTKTYVQTPNIGGTEQTNSFGSGSDFAYYGRAQAADIPILDLNGWNGSHFYGAMDTDRADPPDGQGGGGVSVPWNPIALNWTDINIAGYENLEFSGIFGEADTFPTGESWQDDTSVIVEAQIDGAGFFQIFGIESGGGTAAPREDTNFDGVGDGTEIFPTMAEFTKSIAGTGSLLDLRITINNLTDFQKDIGFDDITVVGSLIPEPSSIAVLSLIAVGLFCGRRRRK
ncbi:PEP-CTERM sorting domain-containing protein [Vicingaceae bacterium]|nr:PEP-CTERM sorting domain-containing protein [Vicingaceae bacterium]